MNDMPLDLSQSVFQVQTPRHLPSQLTPPLMHLLAAHSRTPSRTPAGPQPDPSPNRPS